MFMFVFFVAIAMSVVTESCPTSSVPTVKTSSSSFEMHVIFYFRFIKPFAMLYFLEIKNAALTYTVLTENRF